jgi:ParB family transcriptional regulator, chromosome partitioning protein
LVQIETAFRNPKERQPEALSRNEYTEVDAPEDENEDSEPVKPCEASKTAIVVYGEGAGTTRTVCTDPDCPVHHPRRVVPIDPDAEERQKQHEKEQARRKRLMKQRAETFNRILDSAPTTFTAPQLRVLLRALIHIDSYDFADDVAAHFVSDDENNQQTGEEVLLSVVDGLEDDKLSSFALRLALTGHADIPRENEIDHLAEAEAVFAPPQPKKAKAKKTTPKKAAKKPTPIKTKTAKKKTTKKLAA